MFANNKTVRVALVGGVAMLALGASIKALACGGFFCQQVAIDQAGEQIIFRQDGEMVTAVVLIQYEGSAEDFSWVVPVPGVPELSVGSDLVFSPLESATRPQFNLEVIGTPCPNSDQFLSLSDVGSVPESDGAGGVDDGVEVLQQQVVGPFETVVVASDDPEALAAWLEDNGYDLIDPGPALIAPYVEEGMNFVALRLRQDQGVGDLQPLIMRYESKEPMIPIRLTAVAAQPDMGVIVWLLGDSRAVPLNYLHVTPNYTRLDWYNGTFQAYATYQTLITDAMNEAGGQGFATDYSGSAASVMGGLPVVETFQRELASLRVIEDDAQFLSQALIGFVFPRDKVLAVLNRTLPLPEGDSEFNYEDSAFLTRTYSVEQLAAARTALDTELEDAVIGPLEETLDVLDGDLHMTRFYTTLSPEEMTLDPTFSFNPDLEDQPLERKATMEVECASDGTRWSLTLGEGTGRDGERVIEGSGDPPGFFVAVPVIEQDAVFRSETVTASGPPEVVDQKRFTTLQVITSGGGTGTGGGGNLCGNGAGRCGAGTAGMLLMAMIGLRFLRRR